MKCKNCGHEGIGNFCNNCGESFSIGANTRDAINGKKKSIGVQVFTLIGVFALLIMLSWIASSMLLGTPDYNTSTSLYENHNYTVRVTGTPGLPFSGGYDIVNTNGSSEYHSIDDTIPAEYSAPGAMVSITFQKKSSEGSLKVEVIENGEVVNYSSTSAEYGAVAVATQ